MSETSPLLARADESRLVVVDIQTRLADAIPKEQRERCMRNTGMLVQTAALLGIPVTATEQYPDGLGHTDESIRQSMQGDMVICEKTSFSCCGNDSFVSTLDVTQQPQVILCGMESHVCVLQTAMELLEKGFQVFVVEDAICARDDNATRNALDRMQRGGAITTIAESVMFEWLRDAKHPQFKQVSQMIKNHADPGSS